MNFISYAQNFEDVMLWRALKHVGKGFYIDIGANDPNEHSVTRSMYDMGWQGLNCEPVRSWHTKLEESRVNDINLQLAIGSKDGELEFFEVVGTGLSTLDRNIAENHAQEYGFELINYFVPVKTLNSVYDDYDINEVHFLKIDVEGAEKAVLEGIDFKKIRPWIVVVEATKPMSQEVDYEQWEHLITTENYHFVYFDGLNRFYVADEHDELNKHFLCPPNVFDSFTLFSRVEADTKISQLEDHVIALEIEVNESKAEAIAQKQRADRLERRIDEAEARANALEKDYRAVINNPAVKASTIIRNLADKIKSRLGIGR